jgi:predicted DCC family thiol-disulfide oxidoreductase YuxK
MAGELIYDGDCGFCRKCVDRWRQIAGPDAVAVPYQTAASEHPEVPLDEFRHAVQFIDEAGRRTSGAEAIFESLRHVQGYRWLAAAYHRVPLFASASRWIYLEVAGHRKSATWITRLLWGASLDVSQYQTSVWIFRRLLALVFVVAFASFGVQARGLIGSQGILPLGPYLDAVYGQLGASAWRDVPTVFWWWRGDIAIAFTCWVGIALAIVSLFGFLQRAIFAILFILYLSLVTGGQVFMGYQWDFLLLESGFLAIFLTPSLPRVFLVQWLLFRLMFESGCVKLLSHDATWANLTALAYHYQTQPLPTPLAWYAIQAPLWFQKLSTASVFAIELGAPFLIFGPRRMKQAAAAAFVLLQTFILLTGNYAFFNWLAIFLCVALLDDRFWGNFLARVRRGRPLPAHLRSGLLSAALTACVLFISGAEIADMFSRPLPAFARRSVAALAPFGIINSYGLFATMTTIRIEIEVQGSDDGEHWQSYGFPYKPGDPSFPPRWVAPHQPRLDWQMWFAALGNYRENPWFTNFVLRLLTASPDVLRLIARDPFHGNRPKYVRALAYEYRFGDIHDLETAGLWWHRELKGVYFPSAGLREQ